MTPEHPAPSTDLFMQDLARRYQGALGPYLAPPPLVAILSGPAGAGKDSVLRRVREMGFPFRFVVTTTDRCPRPGEVHGVDYIFVSTAEFHRLLSEGAFLEYANVYGQLKGVQRAQVSEALASGQTVLLRLDVQGTDTIHAQIPQACRIFIAPPSLDVLVRRLRERPGDSEEQRRRRIEEAVRELERAREFEYVVVNHDDRLDEAARQVIGILQAEACRTHRLPVQL